MVKPFPVKIILLNQKPGARDPRFQLALRFLEAKGYIETRFPPPIAYRGKLRTEDLLWACSTVQPEWLELIPAILVRFPGHFEPFAEWPYELFKIAMALKEDNPAPFRGIPFHRLKEWLQFQPGDKRLRKNKKKHLSVRLTPDAQLTLSNFCDEKNISKTEALHSAIGTLARGRLETS